MDKLPRAALRLALTAGGNGALVACLDREAVAGIAGGVAGIPVPASDLAGDVVLAAAEAIVRDTLRHVSNQVPGIAGDAQRVVRLADNSLLARTPHHAVDVRLTVAGRSGSLSLLVPSWMLSPGKVARPVSESERNP